ncbi:MAG: DHA2 family efflux MFS transporter permease subunit [Atopobiaceae bacterium]|jgi:EmrB/QacA subfamily drug resistance transporter|nr:DHA2 family efflux MFS transporter permease subunit [Atopobiaceae bacterium]MCH4180560.1 DHA2 family efflux MFS transporter permease subunit [Atopobiaceae bacterium]MCH4214285.1 DHA2 family efflux MFS transporter permease subunit [Atopobiaceae bacterium]MCH4229418.1 DHA2 family efflux MFS transporter permease subunit [Atopobiaceae bacterium]MCH4276110.1 DHA2 family efflux MFS transporter permease subunit [Atopobiaceae bacterium]
MSQGNDFDTGRPSGAGAVPVPRVLDRRLVLSVVACGIMSFAGVVVETAMNVAFPALMAEFSIDTATVQWMTTGYLVVLAAVIPTSAFLGRRFPTRRLFVAAALTFLVGLLVCAAAPSFPVLLVGRLVQGLGTGVALPLMFNVIIEQTPHERMGLMMGVGSLVTALAPAVGPSVGGLVIELWGWRMVFVCLMPLLAVALVLGLATLRQAGRLDASVRFDARGEGLLALLFSSFIVAISLGTSQGITSPVVLVAAVLAVLSALGSVRHARSAEGAILDLRVFRSRGFSLGIAALMLLQLVVLALGYLIPNYSQLVCGEGAAVAGSLMLPGCLLGALLAPVSGRILDTFGARRPILLGNCLVVLAVGLMLCFSQVLSTPTFIGFYVVFTLGQGLTVGNTMTSSLATLPAALKADGNAVVNTSQQLAGAMGTAIVTGMVSSAQAASVGDVASATVSGCSAALVVLLVCACAMLGCSVAMLGGHASGTHAS